MGRYEAGGFTLLEVMVAVAVIAMSFTALLASQSQSLSMASLSRFETAAALLARQKLAALELAGYESLSNDSGQFEDEFSEYRWRAEVKELDDDETGIKDGIGLLKLLELTVSRDENESLVVRALIMAKIEPVEGEE
ncbi:type IV pilus modification PilV family protein [Candidatus Electronema sp. TJ]|uniref:type IV pilus modification PilV family protein n=1 Tax=Candidatus Electronema sp. TJ TaxID=3401573 RepID=UPI003AA81702